MTTLLTYDDLKQKGISFSRQHIRRLERHDAFPRHIKVSASRIAWVESEIDTWIKARIADRDRRAAA